MRQATQQAQAAKEIRKILKASFPIDKIAVIDINSLPNKLNLSCDIQIAWIDAPTALEIEKMINPLSIAIEGESTPLVLQIGVKLKSNIRKVSLFDCNFLITENPYNL